MNWRLALAAAGAIPLLAALFWLLGHSGLRPLTGYLMGLAVYWALLALALACCGGWSLRPRLPGPATALALSGLVLAAALWQGAALWRLSPGVLATVVLAAAVNGALEEAFWRGALIPRAGGGGQMPAVVLAALLFVLWHLAPALGAQLAGQDAVRLLAGAALIAPFMLAARLSSGTAGAGAVAHGLVNLAAFAGLAAGNGGGLA